MQQQYWLSLAIKRQKNHVSHRFFTSRESLLFWCSRPSLQTCAKRFQFARESLGTWFDVIFFMMITWRCTVFIISRTSHFGRLSIFLLPRRRISESFRLSRLLVRVFSCSLFSSQTALSAHAERANKIINAPPRVKVVLTAVRWSVLFVSATFGARSIHKISRHVYVLSGRELRLHYRVRTWRHHHL